MASPQFNTPPEGEYWPHSWVRVGDMVISLTQEGSIPQEIWDRFVVDAQQPTTKRMLGLGFGAINVTGKQRRQLVMAMRHNERRAGVLGSSIARGVANALSWMGTRIRVFPWDNVHGALEYLGSPEVDVDYGVSLVEELLARSGAPPIDELAVG